MDAIAADVVPQLMQRLMHCFISERGPVTAPNTNRANGVSGDDIVERLQEKCNTLVRARDFAMDAINSHAGRLLSGIRIQINQQTAIYRLPDEVLAIVFKFTVASEGNSLQPLTTKAPLNVSRVSRAWRAVALSTATLWTTIDVMNAPLAREYVNRSKTALLDIELLAGDEYQFSDDETVPRNLLLNRRGNLLSAYRVQVADFSRFIRPLQPHIARWRLLNLFGLHFDDFFPYFNHAAPHLESFYAGVQKGRFIEAASRIPASAHERFFGGHTPNLHSLELRGVCIPLASPVYHQLASMHLERTEFTHSSIRRLILNLAACPSLEELALVDICFSLLEDRAVLDTEPSTRAALPHLRHVRCSELSDRTVCYILSAIIAPPSLHLSLDMNANATLNTTLPPAVLRGSLPSLEGIQSLELFSGYGAHCRIIGRSSYAGLPTAEILQANFEPEARRGSLGVGTARIFSCLGQDRLPLMHLESLSLREFTEDMYLDAHTFAQVLGSLPSITSLALVECSKRLAEALVVTPTSHVCPRLQELRLHDSKILDETLVELVRSRTTSPTSRSVSRSNSSAGPSYGGSSQSQGESRGALRILKLARCGFVDQASVTQMRAILAVEWDGLGLVRSALPPSSDAVLPELV